MKLLKLYFTYLRIKRRGWPKFKNFREYRKRRKWALGKPTAPKSGWTDVEMKCILCGWKTNGYKICMKCLCKKYCYRTDKDKKDCILFQQGKCVWNLK